MKIITRNALNLAKHCVKIVIIRSFFLSVFSCIRTKYGDLQGKSSHSVWIQENRDQKKLRIWTLFTQWNLLISLLRNGIFYIQNVMLIRNIGFIVKKIFTNFEYTVSSDRAQLTLLIQLLKGTHREKAPSNKTPVLMKSINMDIWVAGTSNHFFIRGSYTETNFSIK